jgi:hypothetical protein
MALRYWTGNATPTSFNWNYNSGGITNWGSASGVADNVLPPTSADDVIFDGAGTKGNSNNTLSANITILSITFTSGYTATATINSSITLTVAGNFTDNLAHTWVVGSVTTSILQISATSNINSGGKIFPSSVYFSGTNTKTLIVDWTILGVLYLAGASGSVNTLNQTGTNTLFCNGFGSNYNVRITGTAGLRTSGNVTFNQQGVFDLRTLEFAGNLTVSNSGGTFFSGNIILKYISGTVIWLSTVNCYPPVTFDIHPIILPALTLNSGGTVTINSPLIVSGTLNAYYTTNTFTGTNGFECGIFQISPPATNTTVIFEKGLEYVINNSIINTSAVNGNTLTSSDATQKAKITLKNNATCNISARFTRIDASGGRLINTWRGTVTDCVNVRSFTDLQTVSASSVT